MTDNNLTDRMNTIQRDKDGENNDFTMTGNSAWLKIGDTLLYIVKRAPDGAFIEIRRGGHTAEDNPDETIWLGHTTGHDNKKVGEPG